MRFSAAVPSEVANASRASARRTTSPPSSKTHAPNARRKASFTSGRRNARCPASSRSHTGTPHSRKRATTLDLPEPMPPIRYTVHGRTGAVPASQAPSFPAARTSPSAHRSFRAPSATAATTSHGSPLALSSWLLPQRSAFISCRFSMDRPSLQTLHRWHGWHLRTTPPARPRSR